MTAPTIQLPAAYQWLSALSTMPRTLSEGLALLGVQEVVGKGSNRTIISWRDELNQSGVPIVGFGDDDIPWCGLFAAIVAHRACKAVPASPLWARHWTKFGWAAEVASLGDVLVFQRPGGGGHVGFYIGEDARCYHVLGGNQSNRVSIARIEKSRCIAVRRPQYRIPPSSVKPYRLAASGGVSKNEA